MPGPWEKFQSQMPTSQKPSPARTPAMNAPMIKGINVGGISIVQPGTPGRLKAEEVSASEAAKQAAQKREYGEFFDQITELGKPLREIEFEDVYKVSGGNLDLSKKFVDLKDAFSGGTTNQEKFLKSSVGIVNALINKAKKIPASGGFYGRQVQGPLNWISEQTGQLPAKAALTGVKNLVGPMLAKGLGDTGNISDTQVKQIMKALDTLDYPQKEVRDESISLLEEIFSEGLKKQVKLNKTPFQSETPTSIKDVPSETLKKLVGL